jgi:hypothetical protein
MKKVFDCWVVSLAALTSASASKPQAYQQTTVLKVQEVDTRPTYVGSNPSDAPLSSPTYSYKVWLGVDCVTYVARYDSWSDQPGPDVFTEPSDRCEWPETRSSRQWARRKRNENEHRQPGGST